MPRTHKLRTHPALRLRSDARGLSIVEMLVGMAVAGAALALASQSTVDLLGARGRELAHARLMQDLRATSDIVARDIRRAGAWKAAHAGVALTPMRNAYASMSPTAQDGVTASITYAYARDVGDDNHAINTGGPNERFGFRHNGAALATHVGGAWQDLNDVAASVIVDFRVNVTEVHTSLGALCRAGGLVQSSLASGCCQPDEDDPGLCKPSVLVRSAAGRHPAVGLPPAPGVVVHAACPQRTTRRVDIHLTGRAPAPHADLVEQVHHSSHARADTLEAPTCP